MQRRLASVKNTVMNVEVIIRESFGYPDSSLENVWGSCFCCSCPKTVEHSPVKFKIEYSVSNFKNRLKTCVLKMAFNL